MIQASFSRLSALGRRFNTRISVRNRFTQRGYDLKMADFGFQRQRLFFSGLVSALLIELKLVYLWVCDWDLAGFINFIERLLL